MHMSPTELWRQLSRVRLDKAELIFVTTALGLAFMVGLVDPGGNLALQILIVVWSGLVGMMIPRIVDARRGVSPRQPSRPGATTPHRSAAPDQLTLSHDMAAALLSVEGGVTALRYMYDPAAAPEVESIAHAIETEIRRIRRLSLLQRSGSNRCGVLDTIAPLIALHEAAGASIETSLQRDAEVAIAADDLARVIENLLDNCTRHAPGAAITVEGRVVHDKYRLIVHDRGPGVEQGLVEGAWQKGMSSLPGGGMGLYSVRSTVESCGGQVCFDLTQPGTAVVLDLPLATADDTRPAPFASSSVPTFERSA